MLVCNTESSLRIQIPYVRSIALTVNLLSKFVNYLQTAQNQYLVQNLSGNIEFLVFNFKALSSLQFCTSVSI